MTGTCDTEGRISVIIGAQDAAGMAAGENERNGAKEADGLDGVAQLVRATSRASSSSSSSSLSSSGRHPARGDLWRNATRPFSSTSGFLPRQFAARLSESRLTNFTSACYLRPSTPFNDPAIYLDAVREKASRRTTLFARRPKHRPALLRGRLNFGTMRIL